MFDFAAGIPDQKTKTQLPKGHYGDFCLDCWNAVLYAVDERDLRIEVLREVQGPTSSFHLINDYKTNAVRLSAHNHGWGPDTTDETGESGKECIGQNWI